jgi:HSP20 family protein
MSVKIIFPEKIANHPEEWNHFLDLFESGIPSKNVALLRPNKVFSPPMDIYETDTQFIVKLEIAGIAPSMVTIEWVGQDLIIRGVRKESTTKKPTHYHQIEIHYGAFERVVRISRKVNPKSAKATYNDGFLLITVPKITGTKTRVIPIENK